MPIYMKYGKINGDVETEGYKDWIELLGMQFGVGRGMTQAGGSGKNREAGKASVSEVSISKMSDESSVPLFQEACKGLATDVKLDMCTVQNDALKPFLQYVLGECMISAYSLSSGGERPNESLSLNFTTIEAKFTPYDTKGKGGNAISAAYNLKTTKAS